MKEGNITLRREEGGKKKKRKAEIARSSAKMQEICNGHHHESGEITGFGGGEIVKGGGCLRTDRARDAILSQQRKKPEKMAISNLVSSGRKCVTTHQYC